MTNLFVFFSMIISFKSILADSAYHGKFSVESNESSFYHLSLQTNSWMRLHKEYEFNGFNIFLLQDKLLTKLEENEPEMASSQEDEVIPT